MDRYRRWCRIMGIAILTAPLLVGGPGCHGPSETAPAAEAGQDIPSVAIVYPTPRDIVRLIEQPGYNRPYEQTPIYSKIAGFVQEWKVDIGDHVKEGQPLVKLWVPEVDQELKSREARVLQAKAEVRQAEEGLKAATANVQTAIAMVKEAEAGINQVEAEYKRWDTEYVRANDLLAKNVFDKQTRDEALHQLQATAANRERAKAKLASMKAAEIESVARQQKAAADVDAARARVEVADADRKQMAAWLDYANIRAPYDGMITQRNIQTGDFVQSSSSGSTNVAAVPLYVIVRMDIMRVTVQVPEYDAVLVKEGMPAVVEFQALKGRTFQGTVTRYTWSLDEQARTLRVEIHLHNTTKEELRPGMYANTTIRVKLSQVFTLPAEAVLDDGEHHYVFLEAQGKAVQLPIKVGVRTKKDVQVLQKQVKAGSTGEETIWEDFTGHERVIATNPASLIDGQAVRPK